jgi:hypothetical protein
MKTLRYRGMSHVRSISAADFASLGIEHEDISIKKGETVKVSDDAAEYLLKSPKDWVEYRPRLERDEPAPEELSSQTETDSSQENVEQQATPVDAPETTNAASKSRSRSRDKEA